MDESPEQGVHPPVEPAELVADEPQTKWPKVIGVISLIYGFMGLLCNTINGVWLGLADMVPEMWRGGMEIPPLVRVTGIVQVVLTFGVGILMVMGSVSLLRRRRAGPGRLKKWVLLRMVLIVAAVVVMVLTGPAQIQMQRSMLDYRNDALREADMTSRIVEKTDDELWRSVIIQGGIAVGIISIYPVFLGLWLSRKKITAEVEQWG